MKLFSKHCVFAIIYSLFSSFANSTESINLYTYHQKPPFIVDNDRHEGFYFSLAELLSKENSGVDYQLYYVPRKRLDVMLSRPDFDGIVLGAVPAWFKDKLKTKYLWSDGYFEDKDHFVSLKTQKFEHVKGRPLKNVTVGKVAGLYYKGVTEQIKRGELLSVETTTELAILKLIEKSRVDVGIISDSAFKYYQSKGYVEHIFHLSSIPHDEFNRRAFTTKNNHKAFATFQKQLKQLMQSEKLQNLVSYYTD
ncbi:MAG: transporter substrate-binding domain-containing protein [Gammaproteobacteria bacterium]|nr:transporter substrate-binding domain-containing protein [Gammaproteobacteria bacterium]